MARSRDAALRLELLDRVVEYLAANGLGAASLRPIAQALDVSLNRLVHHFGTKQELVAAALDRVIEIQVELEQSWVAKRPSMSQLELHRRWWRWINASPANMAVTRLGYEAATLDATASGLPGAVRAAQVGVWREGIEQRLLAAGLPAEVAHTEASLIKATFTGLVTDLIATGDRRRLTLALEEWLCRLEVRLEELRAPS